MRFTACTFVRVIYADDNDGNDDNDDIFCSS